MYEFKYLLLAQKDLRDIINYISENIFRILFSRFLYEHPCIETENEKGVSFYA